MTPAPPAAAVRRLVRAGPEQAIEPAFEIHARRIPDCGWRRETLGKLLTRRLTIVLLSPWSPRWRPEERDMMNLKEMTIAMKANIVGRGLDRLLPPKPGSDTDWRESATRAWKAPSVATLQTRRQSRAEADRRTPSLPRAGENASCGMTCRVPQAGVRRKRPESTPHRSPLPPVHGWSGARGRLLERP